MNVPLHTKDVNVKGVEVYKLAQETYDEKKKLQPQDNGVKTHL